MSEEAKTPAPAEAPLDLSDVTTAYTNWYRVTGTPEELMLEFALTPHLGVVTEDPIRVKQRLVMSYYTAKRLLAHLHYALRRHEDVFGPLEMDIRKRMKGVGA
jgi:hypothetical protein